MRRAIALGMVAVLVVGAAVFGWRQEEELIVSINTDGWPGYCLGYHRFIAPPDLEPSAYDGAVDGQSLSVLHNTPGTPQSIIEAREDFGGIVHRVDVNGWVVIVALEDMGLVVSDYTYVVYGARRVGEDVVLTSASASRKLVGDGNDPRLWEYHARTLPVPIAERGDKKGYCLNGIFFASPPPLRQASFSAFLAETDAPNLMGEANARNENSLRIDVSIEQNPDTSDGRPLFPSPDISTFPEVDVASEKLRVMGNDTGLATTTYRGDDGEGLWYDAAIYGQPNSVTDPALIALQYANDRVPPEDSRAMMLAVLAGLTRN